MESVTMATTDPTIIKVGDKVETPFFSRESWPLVDRAVYENKRMVCIVTDEQTSTELELI